MAEHRAGGRARSQATLSVDDVPTQPPVVATREQVGEENVTGQFSAVINIHACNLRQIEVAIENNAHEVDPHPALEGQWLGRHPIYLVCFNPDPGTFDEQGRPRPGEPADPVDLATTRKIFSGRYPYVAPGDPPKDGSHISVQDMHVVPEFDAKGVPTGRVRLGNPSDVPAPKAD